MQPHERQQPEHYYWEPPRPRPPATRGKQDLVLILLVLNLLMTGYLFLFVRGLADLFDPSTWLPGFTGG